MNLPLKFLSQNSEPFVPVTTAEAVMVLHPTGVKRLDQVLNFKIEEIVTPAGSGLTSYRQNNGAVLVAHSNNITPSTEEFKPKLIKYDNRGHIVDTQDVGQLKVVINGTAYQQYDGSQEKFISFGADFMNDDGDIQIRWYDLQ